MECVKIKFSPASNIFIRPIFEVLPLFGFAKNEADAKDKIFKGKIKVNREVLENAAYKLQAGDLVEWKDCGIIVEREE